MKDKNRERGKQTEKGREEKIERRRVEKSGQERRREEKRGEEGKRIVAVSPSVVTFFTAPALVTYRSPSLSNIIFLGFCNWAASPTGRGEG